MRNWLIRTKNNKILGPLPKAKVLELYNAGDLKDLDEVCSGNGYWFWIKEKELVEKYLIGEIDQGFNPVSEAKTVLSHNSSGTVLGQDAESSVDDTRVINIPFEQKKKSKITESAKPEDDFEYPDEEFINQVKDTVEKEINEFKESSQETQCSTLEKTENKRKDVPEIEIDLSNIDETEVILPSHDDLDYPNDTEIKNKIDQETTSPHKKDKKTNTKKRLKQKRKMKMQKPIKKRNDILLLSLIILMLFAIIFIFFTQYNEMFARSLYKKIQIISYDSYAFTEPVKKKLILAV